MQKDRQIPGSCQKYEKLRNMKVMVIPILVRVLQIVSQRPGKKTGGMRDQKKNWDHPDHSTVKIS